MKVLFLGQERILHPWYDDVRDLAVGKCDLKLFDPTAPLEEQFRGAEVIVDQGGVVGTPEMIELAARNGVKLWQVLGTGLDHTPVDFILKQGLRLANTPGSFSAVALAEHALFFMLFFSKQFFQTVASLKAGLMCVPMNEELEGKTLGLIGFGASARALAARTAPLGMRLLATDVVRPDAKLLSAMRVEFHDGPDALRTILPQCDYVSLHLPLTAETKRLIDAEALGLMKPKCVLVNVSRGELVDEEALFTALQSRAIRGAALDVFVHEPVALSHPLLTLDNVIATPHMAGVTTGTSRRRAEAVVKNIELVAAGQTPLHLITPGMQS